MRQIAPLVARLRRPPAAIDRAGCSQSVCENKSPGRPSSPWRSSPSPAASVLVGRRSRSESFAPWKGPPHRMPWGDAPFGIISASRSTSIAMPGLIVPHPRPHSSLAEGSEAGASLPKRTVSQSNSPRAGRRGLKGVVEIQGALNLAREAPDGVGVCPDAVIVTVVPYLGGKDAIARFVLTDGNGAGKPADVGSGGSIQRPRMVERDYEMTFCQQSACQCRPALRGSQGLSGNQSR